MPNFWQLVAPSWSGRLIHGWKMRMLYWISDGSNGLHRRFRNIEHTGCCDHCGFRFTTCMLWQRFLWSTLSCNIWTFFRFCMQFLSTIRGARVPCSFFPPVYWTVPKKLLQIDRIMVVPSALDNKYTFMPCDDHSECVRSFYISRYSG